MCTISHTLRQNLIASDSNIFWIKKMQDGTYTRQYTYRLDNTDRSEGLNWLDIFVVHIKTPSNDLNYD